MWLTWFQVMDLFWKIQGVFEKFTIIKGLSGCVAYLIQNRIKTHCFGQTVL